MLGVYIGKATGMDVVVAAGDFEEGDDMDVVINGATLVVSGGVAIVVGQ